MASGDKVKIQHDVVIPKKEPETPEDEGEKSIGGEMPDLESDDDTNNAFEDTFGNPPKGTIGEEIEKDKKGEEDKKEEEE